MASLAELKSKVKGIKSIEQVTRAMQLVAGARFTRAQKEMVAAGSFITELEGLLYRLLHTHWTPGKKAPLFPFLSENKNSNRMGLLVIAGDRGLCGGFNNNVLKETLAFRHIVSDKKLEIFTVGRKAEDSLRKSGLNIFRVYDNIAPGLRFDIAAKMAEDIMDVYLKKELGGFMVISNRFHSIARQEVEVSHLLPVRIHPKHKPKIEADYLFEPERNSLLAEMIPFYLKNRVYSFLKESYASEQAARLVAMENATLNAGDLIENLNLEFNKLRQASITSQIADIVGAGEGIK
ncbi:MAG: ATP synthase F1 subunit gamma [Candidatus Ratteibacteria bacterium]|jgi:F-type H+-transporting ATPase subunit gamma